MEVSIGLLLRVNWLLSAQIKSDKKEKYLSKKSKVLAKIHGWLKSLYVPVETTGVGVVGGWKNQAKALYGCSCKTVLQDEGVGVSLSTNTGELCAGFTSRWKLLVCFKNKTIQFGIKDGMQRLFMKL